MPYLPCAQRPAIHHNETPIVSAPMRPIAASARRTAISRETHMAYTNQSTGPMPAKSNAVALTPPTIAITTANHAGHRHPPSRPARIAMPMSQGSAANGRRITEMRAA